MLLPPPHSSESPTFWTVKLVGIDLTIGAIVHRDELLVICNTARPMLHRMPNEMQNPMELSSAIWNRVLNREHGKRSPTPHPPRIQLRSRWTPLTDRDPSRRWLLPLTDDPSIAAGPRSASGASSSCPYSTVVLSSSSLRPNALDTHTRTHARTHPHTCMHIFNSISQNEFDIIKLYIGQNEN
jgi:hypothetical protein